MPEFQRHKRRSLTDEQLYEEYNRTDEPKRKAKKSGTPQKKQKPAPARETRPTKETHPARETPHIKETRPAKAAPPSKKPPSSAGTPSAGETPPTAPSRREMREEQRQEPPRVKNKEADKVPRKKSSAPPKKPSQKATARKKRGKMTLYYVLIGIVATAAVSILSVTVLFNINSFQVMGETVYTNEEIIAACGIEKGDNLLRINVGNAEEQIVSKLVYIDTAKISRGFPNRLVITVEPASPALCFASGGRYYIISKKGRLLEIGRSSPDCPVVRGYIPAMNVEAGVQLEDDKEGRLSIAIQMTDYMQQYGLNGQCEINLTDTLNIIMMYEDRVEMELGAATRLEDKFYHASLLLKDEISSAERCILILSNPDRVVKRPVYDTEPEDTGSPTAEPEEPPEMEGGSGGC